MLNRLNQLCDVQFSHNRLKIYNMLNQYLLNSLVNSTLRPRATTQHVVTCHIKKILCVHHIFLFALIGTFLISGCSVTPTTVVNMPTTARAVAVKPPAADTGAIYNTGDYRAMFEDRKPRRVGDIITINIVENTSATKSVGSSASKDGAINTTVTSLFGTPLPSAAVDLSGSSSFSDTADANASNVFRGSITTTVLEILPNGYFLVSGEKQVSLDKATEFVRFSGVVNPDNVAIGNTVSSTLVADARVEYRTASKIDAAELANIAGRFFFSVLGF